MDWPTPTVAAKWKTTSTPSRASAAIGVAHIADHELDLAEKGSRADRRYAPAGSGRRGRERDARRKKAVGEMRADEAGAPGDQDLFAVGSSRCASSYGLSCLNWIGSRLERSERRPSWRSRRSLAFPWRAGVVLFEAQVGRRKTKRQGNLEGLERLHLAIEPRRRLRSVGVGPAEAGADMAHRGSVIHATASSRRGLRSGTTGRGRRCRPREVTGRRLRLPSLRIRPR